MTETVILTGRCERRRHRLYRVLAPESGVLYRVVETSDGLVVVADRYCAGRDKSTWTPMRRELTLGRGVRYGCGCGRTALVADEDLWRDIRRGVTERLEPCYSIGLRASP